jgi:N-acyl-D-amino-acid deacylase
MKTDILIRGGLVVDGTGGAARQADVGIMGERIAFIGNGVSVAARQVIDASGQVVSPGFIDIHTHSDMSLMLDGRAQSKVSQGVTTEVTGNCGFSPFPINPEHLQLHLDLLAGIGDDAMALTWVDLEGYRQAAESRGIAINMARCGSRPWASKAAPRPRSRWPACSPCCGRCSTRAPSD